jgi:hypothetical protein
MTTRHLDSLNRRIDVMYRATYLKEPYEAIAKDVGLSDKQAVSHMLDRDRENPRIMEAVAMRVAEEKKKEECTQFLKG